MYVCATETPNRNTLRRIPASIGPMIREAPRLRVGASSFMHSMADRVSRKGGMETTNVDLTRVVRGYMQLSKGRSLVEPVLIDVNDAFPPSSVSTQAAQRRPEAADIFVESPTPSERSKD